MMSERWVKVTLLTGKDEHQEHEAWVNMEMVPVIVKYNEGSKLEFMGNHVYIAKENPEHFLEHDDKINE